MKVRSSELIEVSINKFMTPSAFIFLYENNLFLTFRNRTVAVWNFRGELVTSFEDHLLWHQDCSTNNIYITSDQDLIISYCKSEAAADESTGAVVKSWFLLQQLVWIICTMWNCFHDSIIQIVWNIQNIGIVSDNVVKFIWFRTTRCAASPIGSINMSDIMTGKCIAKIAANDPALSIAPRKIGRPAIWSTIPEALEDVTALFYDEDRNEIYTGNSHGLVHVWSS